MASGNNEISAEEFAQYDRQIRLWGLDAQKRLRKANVLVAGIGGLGSEVVKNIVLAGIDSITLLDDRVVTEEDLFSQLLVTPDDIGKNLAEASKPRTQELNPNVTVIVDVEPLAEKQETFFEKFDVVCCTCCTASTRIKINNICRKMNVKFFCGDVYGFYGYCFADLKDHEFVEEVEVKKSNDQNEPSNKKRKLEKDTVSVLKAVKHCSYEESLKEDWSKRSRRSLRQSSQVFFILQIIDNFRKQFDCLPQLNEDNSESLKKIKEEVLLKFGVNSNFVNDNFTNFCCSALSPICAIVGGVLGQEVIKVISKKDAPHENYFFFDGTNHSGVVDNICSK
uniref:SUMO-activating enzyme subunit 1 n=1 Tax=Phallusia mammillata TaxID=59560 RepID=A0A6F9DQX2_9ASCI|nr:SUMO-activating enzyme subunit 1-like [Phallusia mammillata]